MPQFSVDFFVAAVNVINAVDLSGAAGGQTRKDECSRCAQVTGHNGSAAQGFAPFDDGAGSFDFNIGAEAGEFADMPEAGLEDTLSDDADSWSERHPSHH